MREVDLGALNGDVLLFGGPYSNLHSTRALLEVARAADHLICTGDVVAYGAHPVETIDEIRASGAAVVAGNVEKQLAAGAADCGCGFEPGTACDVLSVRWYAHADVRVGLSERTWMAHLPDRLRFSHAGLNYCVIHGGVMDVSRFLWSCTPESVYQSEISALSDDVDVVIAGHSGISFARDVAGKRWINAGVIGMPPHDGTAESEYVWLRGGVASHHRLSYDAEAAQVAMIEVGLVQGYHTSLLSGEWPSEDVLPPQLRRPGFANG